MGIRFICPRCDKKLNVKMYLAGKRGICPKCEARIRIPVDSEVDNQAADFAGDKPRRAKNITSCIAERPNLKWYVRPADGGEFGPASGEMLQSWVQEKRIDHRTQVRRDDWLNWQPAENIFTEFQQQAGSSSTNHAELNHEFAQTELQQNHSVALLERPPESLEKSSTTATTLDDGTFFEVLETSTVGGGPGSPFANLQVDQSTLAHHSIRRSDPSSNKIKGIILACLSVILLGSLVAVVILSQ